MRSETRIGGVHVCACTDNIAECNHSGGPEVSLTPRTQIFSQKVLEPGEADPLKMGIRCYAATPTHLTRCSIAIQRLDHPLRCMSHPPPITCTAISPKSPSIPSANTRTQTPVGMSSFLMHNNPALFPNPRSFSPERWLQPHAAELRKYIVSFSKGSRQCLGMKYAPLILIYPVTR